VNAASIAAVALGGAFGSIVRYFVSIYAGRMFGTAFPWGTLFINVSASFILGALAEIFALKWQVPIAIRALLVVGVCGGYSTFSTFSLEVVTLMNRGATVAASAYVVASILMSVGALLAALRLVRALVV
jgi:fluoride exporter